MEEHNEKPISTTTLTLADNSRRLRKFRTRTIVTEQFGKKMVWKFSVTEEANTFLKAIVMRETANAKYLRGHFDVLCGNLKGNRIEYEYMPYQSLSQRIGFELTKNRYDKADELLGLYVQKVHALNKLHICPKEFVSMVAQDTVRNCRLEVDCLSRGLLDLTPRNILVDGSRWVVVDNEWSFDFPVPVVFVLFRAIREVVVGLQHEIRRCTTKTRPGVGVFARGLRTDYFPKDWVKYISDNYISFAQMLRWEMGFQRYITGTTSGTVGRVKINPKTKFHFPTWRLRDNIGIVGSVSHLLKKLPAMRQLVYFLERTLVHLQK